MKNRNMAYYINLFSDLLSYSFFLIVIGSGLNAQEDPLKIEENGDVKILKLKIGDWTIFQQTNGALIISSKSGSKTTLSPEPYKIGLNHELGGYVFYVTPNGKHGLVAATNDQGIDFWKYVQNLISDPVNHNEYGKEFTDWRLPTKNELHLMYIHKAGIGLINNTFYWSSTEEVGTEDNFYYMNALTGTFHNSRDGNTFSVRAIRAF